MFFFKQLIHCISVTDICFHETEIRVIHNGRKRGQIARIRQLVKHGDVHVRMIARHVPYEIRTDEPASAGYQNMFRFESLFAHCFSNRLPDSNITNANKGA